MKKIVSRQSVAAGVVVLACLIPLLAVGAYAVSRYRWAEARLAELEPRYARLQGFDESRSALTQAAARAKDSLAQYVYPASLDVTQAGNDAQQRARATSSGAGLSVVSSQVLPAKAEGPFEKIPLTVRLEGDLPALQAALLALSREAPSINFEGMTVQALGAARPELAQRLSIQFNLFVLRARS